MKDDDGDGLISMMEMKFDSYEAADVDIVGVVFSRIMCLYTSQRRAREEKNPPKETKKF